MPSRAIPVNTPVLDDRERELLSECVRSGWISSEGPFVAQLEEGVAHQVQRKHGIAVCNGTAALDVAVACLQLDRGCEVILPSFTIISCASAVVRAGLIPVVVDADPRTWNMRVEDVEAAITPRTRAILAVHLYGLPVDMQALLALASRHDLRVIEDAAEGLGQTCRGAPCGSFGDLSILSFYPNKLVTTGEGGMVLTDDPVLAARARSLRNLCFTERRFVHEELGWNYRMSNLQAAVGVAQLERLEASVQRKREIGARYQAGLRGLRGVQLPLASTDCAENLYWVFGLVLDDSVAFDAAEAMLRFAAKGIGSRPFFWPMHEQPVFQKMGLFRGVQLPHCERLARRGLYIPSGLGLTNSEIDDVIIAVREVLA